MDMPDEPTAAAMLAVVKRSRLDTLLGNALFMQRNWHQSLSDRYWPHETPDLEARLLRVGPRIAAHPVQLVLNRIASRGAHWAFMARGKPKGFAELLAAIRMALATEGFDDRSGHTPHATISYRAPTKLKTLPIAPPIPWVIKRIQLVKSVGSGDSYGYQPVAEWPLQEPPQLELFNI
ncbi:2'-5' RNA ligase family protein [Roseateles sp. NT4]|uniref:2'-5' RNA ligase family protein n=1 Tax=Roseateles sp. NT4 TaxID=3453715 RepID=UPI003EEC2790